MTQYLKEENIEIPSKHINTTWTFNLCSQISNRWLLTKKWKFGNEQSKKKKLFLPFLID